MKGSERIGGNTSEKKLGDAKGEEETQQRCRTILEAIAPGRVKSPPNRGDCHIVLPGSGGAWWVYLRPWYIKCIAICIYPGNNMSQAQAFFKKAIKREFLRLVDRGWEIQPSLALNYVSRYLPTEGNNLSLEQYFDYWASEDIRQIRRENNGFEDLSDRLATHGLIGAKDIRKIKKEFIGAKRDFINICPGFEVTYAWGRAKANRLDRDDQFLEAVRTQANEALGTWGQSL